MLLECNQDIRSSRPTMGRAVNAIGAALRLTAQPRSANHLGVLHSQAYSRQQSSQRYISSIRSSKVISPSSLKSWQRAHSDCGTKK